MCPQKLHKNVHINFIHNTKKLKCPRYLMIQELINKLKRWQRLTKKGQEGTFEGDGNVLYLKRCLGIQEYSFVKTHHVYI